MRIVEVIKEADIGTKIVATVLLVSLILSGILIAGSNKKETKKTARTEKLEEINIVDNSSGILINEGILNLENGVNYLIAIEQIPQEINSTELKYTSSNEDVATVNELGLIKTKAVGSAVITVVSDDNEKIKDEVEIKVTGTTVGVEKISLSESNLSLTVGQTWELKPSILPENATDKSISWASSNGEIATIDSFGKVSAKKEGKMTITAKAMSGVKSTCEVEVIAETEPESVELSNDNLTIKKGETYNLSATVKPDKVKNKGLTWSSDNTGVVEVNDEGKVTGIGLGVATVTVRTSNARLDSLKVTVIFEESAVVTTPTPEVTTPTVIYPTGISLDSVLVNIYPGEQQQLTAMIAPDTATNKNITWLSNNTNIATVNGGGLITGVSPGETLITARTSNGKTTNVRVVINEDPNSPTGVSLSTTSVNIYPGEQQLVTAKVEPNTATNKEISWSSNNSSVVNVNSNGLITAINTGEAIVTARTSNGKTTNVRVVVINHPTDDENDDNEEEVNPPTPVPPTTITLNLKNVLLGVNKRQQILVNFIPNNVSDKSITWSSSNTNVATVTNNGLITAKNSGTTTITAKTNNNKTATATITVTGGQVTTIPTRIPTTITTINPTVVPTAVVVTDPPIEPGAGATIVKSARSNTLITSIEKKSNYYVTRIWVKDPINQFRKAITSGWGKYFETVNTMADREVSQKGLQNKIMVAINASAWHTPDVDKVSGYDYTSYGTFTLVDGQIKKNKYTDTSYRSHSYYVIDGSGNLRIFSDNKTNRPTLYQTMINAGVKNTFSFSLPAIVNKGEVSIGSGGAEAKRQTFCQINKNNFVIVTVNGEKTVYDTAVILKNLGCKTAVNFDGGSSIRLTFKSAGEDKVTTITGGARKVVDIFYVTE